MPNSKISSEHGLADSIAACRLKGAQITPLREAVLEALWFAERPLGAYELRDHLSEKADRKLSAPSVYRTLDFLCGQGVAVRIESRNAYIACKRPHCDHACILFVCNACGLSSEIENKKLERLLAADAAALGFSIDHRVLELSGSCADCRG